MHESNPLTIRRIHHAFLKISTKALILVCLTNLYILMHSQQVIEMLLLVQRHLQKRGARIVDGLSRVCSRWATAGVRSPVPLVLDWVDYLVACSL